MSGKLLICVDKNTAFDAILRFQWSKYVITPCCNTFFESYGYCMDIDSYTTNPMIMCNNCGSRCVVNTESFSFLTIEQVLDKYKHVENIFYEYSPKRESCKID